MSASKDTTDSISSKIGSSFNTDIVKEVLKTHSSNPKTKISDDAAELMSELTKILVIESSLRAAKQASAQNQTQVTLDHMESALPQIMLDFP